ncbi:FAD-dependent oxidoreductase, partial [Enterococcus faecalis]|uniref:FAD-dependent oxidoreductase n=2 Tax=Bacteria TaxID=2 RepID=UPI003D6BC477
GRLRVLRQHRVQRAHSEGDRLRALELRDLRTGRESVLQAPLFIDATETGELLQQAGVEHVLGAEAQSATQEPHALPQADPM